MIKFCDGFVNMLIIEGIVMCFILLLICVTGIANGPVGLVIFYEQEVKDRVIEQGRYKSTADDTFFGRKVVDF